MTYKPGHLHHCGKRMGCDRNEVWCETCGVRDTREFALTQIAINLESQGKELIDAQQAFGNLVYIFK